MSENPMPRTRNKLYTSLKIIDKTCNEMTS